MRRKLHGERAYHIELIWVAGVSSRLQPASRLVRQPFRTASTHPTSVSAVIPPSGRAISLFTVGWGMDISGYLHYGVVPGRGVLGGTWLTF